VKADWLPEEWDSNRYTTNIIYDVPNVKSLLIFCSIHEQDWNWRGLALELRNEDGPEMAKREAGMPQPEIEFGQN
jgi:hypothetical protein